MLVNFNFPPPPLLHHITPVSPPHQTHKFQQQHSWLPSETSYFVGPAVHGLNLTKTLVFLTCLLKETTTTNTHKHCPPLKVIPHCCLPSRLFAILRYRYERHGIEQNELEAPRKARMCSHVFCTICHCRQRNVLETYYKLQDFLQDF